MTRISLSAEYRSGQAYLNALQEKGYRVKHYAASILLSKEMAHIPKETVTAVKVTERDLGLDGNHTMKEILTAAKTKGLHPCPPWVGPQYRLQCNNNEDNTIIGMEPITESTGTRSVFCAFCDTGDRWLGTNYHWFLGNNWVFVSHRSHQYPRS